MSDNEIKIELREIRKLNKRRIINNLTKKYENLFNKLPPLEQKVMEYCYIRGKSYLECAYKLCYCERQVYRIVQNSINIISNYIEEEREL